MQNSHCNEILIIEDEEGIRETLKLALELAGYDVTAVANGQEGLDALRAMAPPRLILLDLMMPVMDGWTFAERLGADTVLASIPVVVVTAFAEKAGSLTSARGFIKKPIDFDSLLRVVKRFCD